MAKKGKIVKGPYRIGGMAIVNTSGRAVRHYLTIQSFSMNQGAHTKPIGFPPSDATGMLNSCRRWISEYLKTEAVPEHMKGTVATILYVIDQIGKEIESGNTGEAITLAAALGVKIQWLAMQPADKPAETGRRQIVNSAKGVEIQHSNIKSRHEEMRKHWAKIRPDCRSDHAADSQTAGEFGVSAKTVQRVRAK